MEKKLLAIVPPIWFFTFLILALAINYLFPALRVFYFALPALGGILFVGGFALTLYASSLFSKENTEILPTSPTNRKLITYGPFGFSRNPMYLGMVLALLGVALFIGTTPVYLAPIAMFLILNFVFIPFEEQKMARQFGAEYEAYKGKVRRWL